MARPLQGSGARPYAAAVTSPPVLSVADAADGGAELELDRDGVPVQPLVLLDLTTPADDDAVRRAAAALGRTSRAVVGLCDGPLPPDREVLAEACTCALALEEQGIWSVAVPDLEEAGRALGEATQPVPRATAVLGPLLRLTSGLPVADGLLAESLAYSMLLAGPELATWRAGRPVRPRPSYDDEAVVLQRDGDVLTVALNRPARHNAYNSEVRDALVAALAVAVHDPTLRVVLRGEGPSFCSGGDLDEFGSTADVTVAHHVRLARSAGALLDALRDRTTVVVHGACIGAGVELPSFAGTVLAHEGARFRLPELAMGLVPGAGGTVSVTRRVGRWRTAWMVLSGAELDVATALRWGLVDGAAD